MAGNKVNAKAKGKDDKGKGNSKSIVPNNDESEDTDFSLLRKPIQTSITGFSQARKIFDMATEELKSLLSDECDLLYECKVCRNLFRSLANFISHKRVYCKDKFNSTVHGHFIKSSSTLNELKKIKCTEEGYQESLKGVNNSECMETDEVDERIPLTKDLTTIIEKIANNKGLCDNNKEDTQVTLQKIPSTAVAVFQNVDIGEDKESENMKNQVNEIDNILSRNIAVLQKDGKFKIQKSAPDEAAETQPEGVIQISDDEDNGNTDELKCKTCSMQFSTQKTLRFHMKYKHVDTRVVYPCPDCLEIFSTSWSVYRHLFKVHRKTAAQIRRLRESIQAKAFKMNNPPAFYEKRKNNMKTASVSKITEEERLDQENQAWMDNMEMDSEMPRCGGCGRTFERRAALAAHTHTCQPRSRALARRPDAKRIEIQIRKDYNKGPHTLLLPAPALALPDTSENKATKDSKEPKEIKEEEISKDNIKKEPEPEKVSEELKEPKEITSNSVIRNSDVEPSSKSASPSPVKVEDGTPEKVENETLQKTEDVSPQKVEDLQPETQPKKTRLPFAQHTEKSNLMALRQRIIPDIELETLRCKKCDTRCSNIQELYDHVAKHYNWMRYACKLCNFKHYHFDKLPEHVKVVHKLKGDKDFYFSTVKAIEGAEALELATPVDESMESEETSPNSRRPSRCSSDSSRVSDESSSSSTRIEGSRKRKITQKVVHKSIGKRRRSFKGSKEQDGDWEENADSPVNVKAFEENSSDMDDSYEKVAKKRIEDNSSVASRRPVRKKAKPKNEDFEYDLSNLLKMEAQGYRESQTVNTTAKVTQPRTKKTQQDNANNYEMLNKECCGALFSLSRKAVENATAHMKTPASLYPTKEKPSTIFVRPMLPRGLARTDKLSPKKDVIEEKKDNPNASKDITMVDLDKAATETITSNTNKDATTSKSRDSSDTIVTTPEKKEYSDANHINITNSADKKTINSTDKKIQDQNDVNTVTSDKIKPKNISIPSVIPLKFRRQSLDVMKNPIVNKNISEFSKAGMKTKILVIKPINRNKDGTQSVKTPLKYQTIKLKESNKSLSDDKACGVVVKVPKVDCISRTLSETAKTPCEKVSVIKDINGDLSSNEEIQSSVSPPKNIEVQNSEINGDVRSESAVNSSESITENKLKSNEVDTTSNCDIKTNTDNDISNTSEETNIKLTKNSVCLVDNLSEKD